MVILDSDHSTEHVAAELKAYSHLVSEGCYLIVHDTVADYGPDPMRDWSGPWTAVQDFLKGNDDFVVDESRERMVLTFAVGGYLKRV